MIVVVMLEDRLCVLSFSSVATSPSICIFKNLMLKNATCTDTITNILEQIFILQRSNSKRLITLKRER